MTTTTNLQEKDTTMSNYMVKRREELGECADADPIRTLYWSEVTAQQRLVADLTQARSDLDWLRSKVETMQAQISSYLEDLDGAGVAPKYFTVSPTELDNLVGRIGENIFSAKIGHAALSEKRALTDAVVGVTK